MENDKLFQLYTLAELAYKKHFEKNIDNTEYLFPENWYESKNYKLKIEITTEAIKENNLIEDTKKYQEIIERVQKRLIKENNN